MTPQLLRKVRELVKAGATVVGPAPLRSPSLSDYPQCDEEVQKLARELWGERGRRRAADVALRQGPGDLAGRARRRKQAAPEAPARLGAAKWIWFKEGNPAAAAPAGKRYFRRVLTLDGGAEIESARMVMTADNEFELWVNGRRAGGGEDFTHTYVMDCTRLLKPGTNLLAVMAVNGADAPNPAGVDRKPDYQVSGWPHGRGAHGRRSGSRPRPLRATGGPTSHAPGPGSRRWNWEQWAWSRGEMSIIPRRRRRRSIRAPRRSPG